MRVYYIAYAVNVNRELLSASLRSAGYGLASSNSSQLTFAVTDQFVLV